MLTGRNCSQGMTHTFCTLLKKMLLDPQLAKHRLVYYISNVRDFTNSAFLLGSFLCLHLNATPAEAWMPFANLSPSPCIPYHDGNHARSSLYALSK